MLTETSVGANVINQDTDQKFYVSYIRALQYLQNFSDTRMTEDESKELKQQIYELKENDESGVNKHGIIDFD